MTTLDIQLPKPFQRRLDRLRRAVRCWVILNGVNRWLWWLVALVIADLAIDRLFRLDHAQRTILLVVMGMTLAVVLYRRLGRPLMEPISDDALCLAIESRHPQLGQSLINSVQLARHPSCQPGVSPALVRAAVARGVTAAEQVQLDDVIDRPSMVRYAGGALLAIAMLLGMNLLLPQTMQLWASRNLALSEAQWPQRTHLSIVDAHDDVLIVPRGDDVRIIAEAGGVIPHTVHLEWIDEDGRHSTQPMDQTAEGRFALLLRNVLHPMQVRAEGGDGRTRWVQVQLVERPSLTSLRLTVTPPDYTGQPRRTLEPGRSAYSVLNGSQLSITATANKALSSAVLRIDDQVITELAAVDDAAQQFTAALSGEQLRGGVYAMDLLDCSQPQALSSRRPTHFRLQLEPDQPPRTRARLEGVSDMAVPWAVVPIEMEFSDDFAITELALVIQAGHAGEDSARGPLRLPIESIALPVADEIEPFIHRLEVAAFEFEPGSHLAGWVEAVDNDTVSGPKTSRSAAFSLRIVSEQELRDELLRREQEQQMELERLLADQQGLEVDTRALLAELSSDQPLNDAQRQVLSGIEQRQRLVASRTRTMISAFQQILAQVIHNRIEEPGGQMQRRISERIIAPLNELGRSTAPAAADQLDRARRVDSAPDDRDDALVQAVNQQRLIIEQLRGVLRHMAKIEGYQEALNLLRQIINAQQRVRQQTRESLEQRIQDIFEP